jgi:hypothetical protein
MWFGSAAGKVVEILNFGTHDHFITLLYRKLKSDCKVSQN